MAWLSTTPALRTGCSVSLHAKFDPDATFDAIERDRITLTVPRPATAQRVSLPVWIPGSYLVREFARHVQELRVTDIADKPVIIGGGKRGVVSAALAPPSRP